MAQQAKPAERPQQQQAATPSVQPGPRKDEHDKPAAQQGATFTDWASI